jgi:hypothetical protein
VSNFPFSLIYRPLAELLLYMEAGYSAFMAGYVVAGLQNYPLLIQPTGQWIMVKVTVNRNGGYLH